MMDETFIPGERFHPASSLLSTIRELLSSRFFAPTWENVARRFRSERLFLIGGNFISRMTPKNRRRRRTTRGQDFLTPWIWKPVSWLAILTSYIRARLAPRRERTKSGDVDRIVSGTFFHLVDVSIATFSFCCSTTIETPAAN